MNKKQRYSDFVSGTFLPIQFQPWWLDAVSGEDGWDVLVSSNPDGGVEGILIYQLRRKLGLRIIDMPFMTAYSGPWLNYPGNMEKNHAFYGFQKRVLTDLYKQLPPHDYFYQRWHPEIQNWLPLKWMGYNQSTLYTFILSLSNTDELFAGFNKRIRRYIIKAEEMLEIVEDESIDNFYKLMQLSFDSKSEKNPYSREKFQTLDRALKAHQSRKIYLARDQQGQLHAGLYVVHDQQTAYNLASGSNPALRTSGAVSLLHWHAIQQMAGKVINLDFEGSTAMEMEQFIRAFGGTLTPHYKVYHARNIFFKIFSILRKTEYCQ